MSFSRARVLASLFHSNYFRPRFVRLSRMVALAVSMTAAVPSHAQVASTTSLTVTSAGSAVTGIGTRTVVTLTASVQSGAAPVTNGVVKFCDATAAFCEDSHLLAMAQLTSGGTASYRFMPGLGSHVYQAVFMGTKAAAASVSGTSTLTVAGLLPADTSLTPGGTLASYTVSASVGGNGSAAPTGTVTFSDATSGNAPLGSATLAPSTSALSLVVAPTNLPVNAGTAVADFNGDGILDIASVSYTGSTGTVAIYLGNGDGTFTAGGQLQLALGAHVASLLLAVGDFNQDGHPDLILSTSSSATILLGNGDGTLLAGQTLSAANNGGGVAVGDLNGDGIPDIVVMNGAASMDVFLGSGDGTFSASPIVTPAQSQYSHFILADFNGDGKLDIAEYGTSLLIHVGNGDGTFTTLPSSISVSHGTFFNDRAVEADFNGDGIPDLAYLDPTSHLTLLLGNGDGTFTSSDLSAAVVSEALETFDVNGDGIPDILLVASPLAFLGNGDGTFTQANLGIANISLTPAATGDFNGDGVTDQLASGSGLTAPYVIFTEHQSSTANITGVSLAAGSGTHQVVATYAGDGNYLASPAAATTLVAPLATPTVALSASASTVVHGTAVTFTASVSGSGVTPAGIVVFFSGTTLLDTAILNNGTAKFTITSLPIGQYSVTAAYSGDAHYSLRTSAPFTLSVVGATPAISFTVPNTTYGAAPISVAATSNSSGAFTYSVASGPATISGSTVTITGAGSVVLSVSQAAGGNYAASQTTAAFTVAPALLAATAVSVSKAPATANPSLTYSLSGFVNNDTSAVVSGTATLTTTTTTNSPVGTYPITFASQNLSAANYTFTYLPGTLTVVSTAAINYGSGFSSDGLSLVGAAVPSGATLLQLTDGGTGENHAAWYPTPVSVQSFTTDFTFQITPSPASPTYLADGFAFVLQNAFLGPYQVGVGGGGLGYAGIGSSVAVKFDLYSNAGEGNDSTGFYTGGANPTMPAIDMTSSGVNLHSGDVMHAHITYDGTTLTLILTDTVTNASFVTAMAINIPAAVGGGAAYVGFTAGAGGFSSVQNILTWTYEASAPPPVSPTINYAQGFTGTGLSLVGASIPTLSAASPAALQLTDGGTGEANAGWYAAPVNVQSFATDFTFQVTPSPATPSYLADGFAFVLQNAFLGPYQVGVGGGGLGYAGIGSSVAVKFDLYSNAGEGNDSTGFYTGGENPTTPAIDMTSSGVNLHSGDVMHAHITYDGTTLTLILTDTVTNASFVTATAINIPSAVGANTAYVGFTAGAGGFSSIQNVLTWTYSN